MAAATCPACQHPVDTHPGGVCPAAPPPVTPAADFETPMDVRAERRHAQLVAGGLLGGLLRVNANDAITRFRSAWQGGDLTTAREQLARLDAM